MRIERIVVGVDFSQPSNAVVGWIARNFPQAELTLVHCISPPQVPRFLARHLPSEETMTELACEGAVQRLNALGRSLGAAMVRTDVRVGPPVDEIIAAARTFSADLVAVGTHGENHGGRGRMGRTAERLARSSPVPVLLCTGLRSTRPSRLLVALDDADITRSVLQWTRVMSGHFDARVTAIHVVSSAVLSHVLSMATIGAGQGEPAGDVTRAQFRDETDRWIRAMVASGLDESRVTSEVDFGEPGHELLAASMRLDSEMIILGSRGAGAARRALLGSVVSEVLHRATCPVLVVVEPQDELVPEPE